MREVANLRSLAMSKVGASLDPLLRLRHPAATAEALFERQRDAHMAVAEPVVEHAWLRVRAVREEFEQIAAAADIRDVVEIEPKRACRPRAIFDERTGEDAAVPPRVENVGSEDRRSPIVAGRETVRQPSEIPPDIRIPLPGGEKAAEVSQLSRDGILDPRALDIAVKLDPQPFPELIQRRVEREIGEGLAAGADVARRIEAIGRQDAVLEQADEVVTELEPGLPLLEQRVLDRQAALPAPLRLQIRIAPAHLAARKISDADEIEEVELRHRAAKDQLAV